MHVRILLLSLSRLLLHDLLSLISFKISCVIVGPLVINVYVRIWLPRLNQSHFTWLDLKGAACSPLSNHRTVIHGRVSVLIERITNHRFIDVGLWLEFIIRSSYKRLLSKLKQHGVVLRILNWCDSVALGWFCAMEMSRWHLTWAIACCYICTLLCEQRCWL